MYRKTITTGLLLLATLCGGQAIAADYKIDIEGQHAFVTFRVGHLGYSFIVGNFNDFEGRFFHDPANPGASSVKMTIDAKSIDTNHAERDKHLRSSDFLDVGKYPTISFESTGYTAGADSDKLEGMLTLHGITRPVEIDVRQVGEGKDPWGGYRSGFRGTTVLDSAEFGMPDWVGDIEVELNIEGIRI